MFEIGRAWQAPQVWHRKWEIACQVLEVLLVGIGAIEEFKATVAAGAFAVKLLYLVNSIFSW